MARTKVKISQPLSFNILTADRFVVIASKPLASPLEVGNLAPTEISIKGNSD